MVWSYQLRFDYRRGIRGKDSRQRLVTIATSYDNIGLDLAETEMCFLKVVSNEMNGGSDVVSIESCYYITQVLGLSLNFYWAVVF